MEGKLSSHQMDWTTAVARALEESIEMFDAVPMHNDLALEYSIPSYALRASMLHTALEQGMKEILRQHYGPTAIPHTHELKKVHQLLPERHRQELNNAFEDAVKFYGFRTERNDLKHLSDLKTYLRTTSNDERFKIYRYWAIEREEHWLAYPQADLLLSREIVRYIADKLTGFDKDIGGPFTVSQAVERKIEETLFRRCYQPLPQREQEDPDGWKADDDQLTEWLNGYSSCLTAIKYAFHSDFNVVNKQASDILRNVHHDLASESDYKVKPALQYALLTFRAKSVECSVTIPALVEPGSNGRSISVKTPAGSSLGLAYERHDGLWTVTSITGQNIAQSKGDAVGLLVNSRTEVVSVSVPGRHNYKARVYFPNGRSWFRINAIRPRDEGRSCEFWDSNHGLAKGDNITVVVPKRDDEYGYRVDGTVQYVDNHEVTIGDATAFLTL